jgi:hypothetical protein
MNTLPAAARVSGAAAIALALSGCYYVGPYPYGYYGAAPYPSPYATTGAPSAVQGAAPGDEANGQYAAPVGPDNEPEDADPNAYAANGNAPPLPQNGQAGPQAGAQMQQGPQEPPPAGVYAPPPPVVAAPAYYPAYPAYPAYYPPYYGGYGWPGWGPGVALNFGFYGHYGHYGHYGYHHH